MPINLLGNWLIWYMLFYNTGTPSFQWHILVNMQFLCIEISTSMQETMLCKVLLEFSQSVLVGWRSH